MIAADTYKQDAVRWQHKTESNQSQAKYSLRFYRESEPAYRSCFNNIALKKESIFGDPFGFCPHLVPQQPLAAWGGSRCMPAIKIHHGGKRSESGLHGGISIAVSAGREYLTCSPAAPRCMHVCVHAHTCGCVHLFGACARMHACALRGKCCVAARRHAELPVLGQRSLCCSQ